MSNVPFNNMKKKIDPITALQEGIDGLSLAMFEALRGLRDAATVEDGDSDATAVFENNNAVTATVGGATGTTKATSSNTLQQEQDSALVQRLVDAVFEKSDAIDAMLDNNYNQSSPVDIDDTGDNTTTSSKEKPLLLYTNRTKDQQMKYIQELITENNMVIQELYTVVQETIQQRDICRQYIIQNSDDVVAQLQQPTVFMDDTENN